MRLEHLLSGEVIWQVVVLIVLVVDCDDVVKDMHSPLAQLVRAPH